MGISLPCVIARIRYDQGRGLNDVAITRWIGIIIMNMPFITHDLKFGAFAQQDDGHMDLGSLPKISRLRLLWVFLRAEVGRHVSRIGEDAGNYISYRKVRECSLEPLFSRASDAERHQL